MGIAGGYLQPVQIGQTVVRHTLGHGYAEAAAPKAEAIHLVHILVLFQQHVFAHNAHIGHFIMDVLGDIVVTQKEHFQGEVEGRGLELLVAVVDLNAALLEQLDGILVQPPRFLNRYF
jgi:adenosylmethionine-8-amino-7-oxononanoate aminotransferase